MSRLDKRLSAVVAQVQGNCLADIGCDHGKVGISCLVEGRVKSVVASDISAPSLQKAKQLATRLGCQNIEFRHCNGFDLYKDDEVDIVVIAGMGAGEIISILTNAPEGIQKFVLVPHTDDDILRTYLHNNDFSLTSDFVVDCKKHFYHIMTAVYGKETLTATQLLLGKNSIENKDYFAYLIFLQNKYFRIKSRVTNIATLQLYKEKLDIIESELQKKS